MIYSYRHWFRKESWLCWLISVAFSSSLPYKRVICCWRSLIMPFLFSYFLLSRRNYSSFVASFWLISVNWELKKDISPWHFLNSPYNCSYLTDLPNGLWWSFSSSPILNCSFKWTISLFNSLCTIDNFSWYYSNAWSRFRISSAFFLNISFSCYFRFCSYFYFTAVISSSKVTALSFQAWYSVWYFSYSWLIVSRSWLLFVLNSETIFSVCAWSLIRTFILSSKRAF